jgi:hypothetical protein
MKRPEEAFEWLQFQHDNAGYLASRWHKSDTKQSALNLLAYITHLEAQLENAKADAERLTGENIVLQKRIRELVRQRDATERSRDDNYDKWQADKERLDWLFTQRGCDWFVGYYAEYGDPDREAIDWIMREEEPDHE